MRSMSSPTKATHSSSTEEVSSTVALWRIFFTCMRPVAPLRRESTESTHLLQLRPAQSRRRRASSGFDEPSRASGWYSGHPRAFSPCDLLLFCWAVVVLRSPPLEVVTGAPPVPKTSGAATKLSQARVGSCCFSPAPV
jgi:hypothetical protein